MSYRLEFSSQAVKFLKTCEQELKERIVLRTERLIQQPYPSDMKTLVGEKEIVYRIRIGKYRIIYKIFEKENIILITKIDKRSRVYD